ncbi:hypothetical protein J2T09_002525 [Neorhizobium huautlense]|uniref:Uncharacterized protein n=1 Tax=Neorhizobium huautlense TaxID=67774 RepID=A0ABT9PUG9_9HYPH|nr:hypothetical protein [Neorhizobium huautlense]MDP9837768.1 hypothetical protein [Neorhizobium huautlense]
MNLPIRSKTTDGQYLIGPNGETNVPGTTRLDTSTMPSNDTDARPLVRTFDVFDTLIARRCIEPSTIFVMVEKRSGLKGFSKARRQAELNVIKDTHDLDLIYAELAKLLDTDPLQLAALKAMELDIERENLIPIQENMTRVRHGDVLVSDMYLGHATIREFVKRAGLVQKVGLVVTNDGKKTGRIWPAILQNLRISEHLGDNAHSDVKMPEQFEIPSRHTRLSDPSKVENVLLQLGLRQLAELCRETRLRTWSENADLRFIQIIQANLNFPMMLMASIDLAHLVRKLKRKTVLFSSRDCDMWIPLFEEVARRMGVACDARYFYTSRQAKMAPSESYVDYARSLFTDDALIVDICGTGWSIAHMADRLGISRLPVYLLHKLPSAKSYEAMSKTPDSCQFFSLIGPAEQGVFNTLLEMCNYSDHGMVCDVRTIDDSAIPVFADDLRNEQEMAAVKAQMDTFHLAVSLMEHYDLNQILQLDKSSIVTVGSALYANLSQHQHLRHIYGKSHVEEETRVRGTIGCR